MQLGEIKNYSTLKIDKIAYGINPSINRKPSINNALLAIENIIIGFLPYMSAILPPISDPKLAAIGESAIITPTSNNESTLSFKYNAKRH